MKTFWDTNVFIYLIEKHPQFHQKVRELFTKHLAGSEELLTSTLTLGELLAQPLRMNQPEQARRYVQLLTTTQRLPPPVRPQRRRKVRGKSCYDVAPTA